LSDDLNTPGAIAELHRLRKAGDSEALAAGLAFLGLFNPATYAPAASGTVAPDLRARIDALVAARSEARATKNWAEADRIREELTALGVIVKDNKDGTATWELTG
jgi:cysteinyl-tRNA synthetase